jgi:hypothetical protein
MPAADVTLAEISGQARLLLAETPGSEQGEVEFSHVRLVSTDNDAATKGA